MSIKQMKTLTVGETTYQVVDSTVPDWAREPTKPTDFAAGGTMGGSLTINGDLTVNGTSTTVETFNENVNVEDNTITLRHNATTGLQNEDYTGIIAHNYDGTTDGMLVFDNNGTAYVGDAGDLQPLATRSLFAEDNGELVSWDAANQTLVKAPVKVENIVTKDNFDSLNTVLSTNTNNAEMSYVKDVPADSANYAAVQKIGGMTYKSKNLIPYPYYDTAKTVNGITFTDNGDGTVTANGTATADAIYWLIYEKQMSVGSFVLSGTSSVTDDGVMIVAHYANADGTPFYLNIYGGDEGKVLPIPPNMALYLYIRVQSGTTVANCVFKPMLNEGSTALPYEPYFEGLRSAKVTEVESVGANLLNIPQTFVKDSMYYGYDLFTGTVGSDTAVPQEKVKTLPYLKAGEYYFSYNMDAAIQDIHVIPVNNDGSTGTTYINGVGKFTVPHDTRITIKVYTNEVVTIKNIMLNKGTTAQPYRPYTRNTFPIPEAVQALEEYGLGVNESVYNYIDWEKKQFVKRVGKAVFDGTEQWNYVTDSTNHCFVIVIQTTLNGTTALCSHFKHNNFPYVLPTGTTGVFGWDSSYYNLYFASVHTSVEEWKAYLAEQYANGNPVTIVYELATPIITDISDILSADNLIDVEGGGTITMVNEYRYAVPSEVVFYNEKADIIASDKIVGNLIGVSTRAISDEDGNSITGTYLKKSNAFEVVSTDAGVSIKVGNTVIREDQLNKLISFIDTVELS